MSGRHGGRALYATIWRWHFYAGLFVIPFVLLLAVTGAAYLFKPQVERWEERAFQGLPAAGAVSPEKQVVAAMSAFRGARLDSYRLPERPGDAAMIRLALPDGLTVRDVFVSPEGEVLGCIAPDRRLMEWLKRIHGQLLLGKGGSWLVELAASWAIALVLSGLYLWWPRDRRLTGFLWPRFRGGARVFWRDLHAVTGFWISALVLVLLVSGLPWTNVWGSAFSSLRTEMGWMNGAQDWTLGGEAAEIRGTSPSRHAHASVATAHRHVSGSWAARLNQIVAQAKQESLAFPVLVSPPRPGPESGRVSPGAWTVKSETQNRPLRMTISYDAESGREVSREGFADAHLVDRVVGYGIAWHEGQLFGWMNQLAGVVTAIGLIVVAASAFILWRKRKPDDALGAPSPARAPAPRSGVLAIVLVLAALLPLLALSLILLALFENIALPHMPRLSRWLGMSPRLQSW